MRNKSGSVSLIEHPEPRFKEINMRHITVTAAVLLLCSSFAAAATPVVNNSTINYNTSPNQITIAGSGFSPQAKTPTVLFNNVGLSVVSFSDTQIIANLPSGTQAATYRLRVTNSQGNSYEFDVTYGAMGPQGPVTSLTFFNSPNFKLQGSSDGNAQFAGFLYGDGSRLTNVNAAALQGYPVSAFALQGGPANFSGVNSNAVQASSFSGDGSNVTNVNATLLQGHAASDFVQTCAGPPPYVNCSAAAAFYTWSPSYLANFITPPGQQPPMMEVAIFYGPIYPNQEITIRRMLSADTGVTYTVDGSGSNPPCSSPAVFYFSEASFLGPALSVQNGGTDSHTHRD